MITKETSMDELDYLLNLDGEIFPMENGFWVKFEVKRVIKTAKMPHGIRYSLTLHDNTNQRVVGYDNAHSFKSDKRYSAQKETYDHIHKKHTIIAYEFDTPSRLIEDFWDTAENYMNQ